MEPLPPPRAVAQPLQESATSLLTQPTSALSELEAFASATEAASQARNQRWSIRKWLQRDPDLAGEDDDGAGTATTEAFMVNLPHRPYLSILFRTESSMAASQIVVWGVGGGEEARVAKPGGQQYQESSSTCHVTQLLQSRDQCQWPCSYRQLPTRMTSTQPLGILIVELVRTNNYVHTCWSAVYSPDTPSPRRSIVCEWNVYRRLIASETSSTHRMNCPFLVFGPSS